jgi:GrpB-like predicted nucleotidyltransferase (UPF0157 family)
VSGRGPDDIAAYDEWLEKIFVGGAKPLQQQIEVREYDPHWPGLYAREADRVRRALGHRVVLLEHVGSTSVPGLPAKPIIDMVLEVADSSDEAAYVPALEAAGYALAVREPEWLRHRLCKGPDTNINLHVFSAGCEETERMLTFRNWLCTNRADRDLYARVKRELSACGWKYAQQYADAKTNVVNEILKRTESQPFFAQGISHGARPSTSRSWG